MQLPGTRNTGPATGNSLILSAPQQDLVSVARDLFLTLTHVKIHIGPSGARDKDCSICFDVFEQNDILIKHLRCGGSWHMACLLQWYKNNCKCPLCRGYVSAVSGNTTLRANFFEGTLYTYDSVKHAKEQNSKYIDHVEKNPAEDSWYACPETMSMFDRGGRFDSYRLLRDNVRAQMTFEDFIATPGYWAQQRFLTDVMQAVLFRDIQLNNFENWERKKAKSTRHATRWRIERLMFKVRSFQDPTGTTMTGTVVESEESRFRLGPRFKGYREEFQQIKAEAERETQDKFDQLRQPLAPVWIQEQYQTRLARCRADLASARDNDSQRSQWTQDPPDPEDAPWTMPREAQAIARAYCRYVGAKARDNGKEYLLMIRKSDVSWSVDV